jgi:DHA2 family multidrug resistance protein
VPINSSILSQFRGAELGQVSGHLNLFRQLGGSAGVAMVATLLTMNSQQNYLDLTSKVTMLNPTTQATYMAMRSGMTSKMSGLVGMASGHESALRALAGRIQGQVFMLSFNQLIWTMMFIFAISLIPWYFLKLRLKATVVSDAH